MGLQLRIFNGPNVHVRRDYKYVPIFHIGSTDHSMDEIHYNYESNDSHCAINNAIHKN